MGSSGIAGMVDALCAQGQHGSAHRLLLQGVMNGDADALFAMAMWRVNGSIIQRDIATARSLFAKAAAAGHRGAALIHPYFLASGTGGPPEWPTAVSRLRVLAKTNADAAQQIALLDRMDLSEDGAPGAIGEAAVLSEAPHVTLVADFLTTDEAAYIRSAIGQSLRPSVVVHPVTGKMTENPIRRSDDAMFGVFNQDLVITAINRRIAALSGTTMDQGEPLIVLRYKQGGEYRAHSDALPGIENQRIATAILYLNADYEGGETQFVETGLSVKGRVGDALLFRNTAPDGCPDKQSRHAGMPITRGVKWIATRWIRASTFTYPTPRPILT